MATRLVLQSAFRSSAVRFNNNATTTLSSSMRLLSRSSSASSSFVVRSYSSSTVLLSNDDLPYHIVVGMPALSPTMETGILAEWYVAEGSEFTAGQSLAKIETDKASIDFEAQDDGVVAKILMEAGAGNDVPVGKPIMVTIEEMEDLDAFKDFELEEEEVTQTPEPVTPEPAAVVEEAPPKVVAATAPPPPPAAAPAPAEPVAAVAPPPSSPAVVEELVAATIAPVMSTGWGEFAKLNSPIVKTLSKQQKEYVEKYGTTGQVPL